VFCLALRHFACVNLPELVDHTTEQTAGRIGQLQTRLGKVNGLDVTALVRLEVDTSELDEAGPCPRRCRRAAPGAALEAERLRDRPPPAEQVAVRFPGM
jgi:hypothetical protein